MVDRLVNSEANAQRIATVENCFGSSGQPLAIKGRVLVGEGVLTKMCRKKPKPRQFFLFNDILVYGNIIIPKKKYNKQHIIPLEEVKLENLEDDGAVKNGWLVRTPTKSFAVYAATANEKTEWMAHINKCVKDLIEKTGKRPTKEHAAVWVPDAEATVCMRCRKSQFTIINRKHHCRKCGAVVCNPCSSKKFLLPSQSSKPLRVCLQCYDMLSKSKGDDISEEERIDTLKEIPPVSNKVDSSGEEDSDDGEEEQEKTITIDDEVDITKDMEELHIQDKPTFYEDTAPTTKEDNSEKQSDDVNKESESSDQSSTLPGTETDQSSSVDVNQTISEANLSNSVSESVTNDSTSSIPESSTVDASV